MPGLYEESSDETTGTVVASSLRTATSEISVDMSDPAWGLVLTAIDSERAVWLPTMPLPAERLMSSEGVVNVSGSTPSVGQVLVATSDRSAEWKTLPPPDPPLSLFNESAGFVGLSDLTNVLCIRGEDNESKSHVKTSQEVNVFNVNTVTQQVQCRGLETLGNSLHSVEIGTGFKEDSFNNEYSVSLGLYAGNERQKPHAIAIGTQAGQVEQGQESIAIGHAAGRWGLGNGSIAIGIEAGAGGTGYNSVCIGRMAGRELLGDNSICIGHNAGLNAARNNSIILNASGQPVDSATNGFFVSPINGRNYMNNSDIGNKLIYDPLSKEITYDIGVAPNESEFLKTSSGAIAVNTTTPSAGQILVAESETNAVWQDLPTQDPAAIALKTSTGSIVVNSSTPSTGQVLFATSPTSAIWQNPYNLVNISVTSWDNYPFQIPQVALPATLQYSGKSVTIVIGKMTAFVPLASATSGNPSVPWLFSHPIIPNGLKPSTDLYFPITIYSQTTTGTLTTSHNIGTFVIWATGRLGLVNGIVRGETTNIMPTSFSYIAS